MDKRLIALILLLVAAGVAWHFHHKAEHERYFLDRRAFVTAQIWVATAKYRNDQPKFIAFRDSLLMANSMTREEITTYLHQYEAEPEEYNDFAELVGSYVDSLAKRELKIEDSITAKDSVK